ncbi:hypothetical protein LWI29_010988 [Acer saccharum]|uniref:Uncharacterized protein n=1 Tax=Acer saccharum TaxID=4024 RepID=A0AA39SHK7_ACESA|nr:hypothetical protein LWI29_010988 [Acer saccharum]
MSSNNKEDDTNLKVNLATTPGFTAKSIIPSLLQCHRYSSVTATVFPSLLQSATVSATVFPLLLQCPLQCSAAATVFPLQSRSLLQYATVSAIVISLQYFRYGLSNSMDPMCMEAALSLSSPVAVSSTLNSQVALSTVSEVNFSSRVVPLASGGMCSLVGRPIPPPPEGGVSVIVPDSVTGLIQSSAPMV